MSGLLIIGAGGHARVVADILRARGEAERLLGFIDATLPLGTKPKGFEAEVVGRDADLSDHAGAQFVIGLGTVRGGGAFRAKLFDRAVKAGLVPATLVHPAATLAEDVRLGGGTVVMAGAVVNTGSTIGHNVILNTRCGVDHDGQIADHVHIAPGVTLSGDCTVGEGALIGVGATVRQGVTIGAGATIAAGAVVVSDVMDGTTVMGVPARSRR